MTTDRGDRLSASFLVMATGCLSVPRYPDVPGVERYRGEAYHTGLWPHEPVDVAGKRVGVVGTGSSAIQAIPLLAETASEVVVFQRTPAFSVPAWNRPLEPEEVRERKARYAEVRALERRSGGGNPYTARDVSMWDETPEQRRQELESRYAVGGFFLHSAYNDLFTDAGANEVAAEFVREKIRERVGDGALGELLCPYDFPLGTKRMCIDTGYYEAYRLDHVSLVDARATPIEAVTERGLRVAGEEQPFDVLVHASGFDAMTGALLRADVRGRGGLPLREAWAEGPRSYLGLTVSGFPNFFTVTGPGSPSVISNMMVSIEQHVDLIADCVAHVAAEGAATIEPSPEAQEAWVDHVRAVGEATLYPRAQSWYMGANVPGKPRVLLPYVGGVGVYRRACEEIVEDGFRGFVLARRGARPVLGAAAGRARS